MIRVFIRKGIVGAFALLLGIGSVYGKEFHGLDFYQLAALSYDPSPPEKMKKIFVRDDREYLERYVTPEVLSLDGKPVEIAGFMLPISTKGDKVREFLLMADISGCCFGMMPAYNEVVFARSKKGVNLFNNIPVRIRGKLTVQEVWQEGFFSHLYFVEVEELIMGFGQSNPSR